MQYAAVTCMYLKMAFPMWTRKSKEHYSKGHDSMHAILSNFLSLTFAVCCYKTFFLDVLRENYLYKTITYAMYTGGENSPMT